MENAASLAGKKFNFVLFCRKMPESSFVVVLIIFRVRGEKLITWPIYFACSPAKYVL